MSEEPTIIERPAVPCVAIRATVTMQTIDTIAHRIGDVMGWLGAHGQAPAGPPFIRYNTIDMAADLEVEVGVPTRGPLAGDGEIVAGELPAGRYVWATHHGAPAGLVASVGSVLAWANARGLKFDSAQTERGEHWGCRVEFYNTDPSVEPNPDNWVTDLAFRLAD
ncbi:MAG TPA: GyrI-like domain-containing protein [Pseudonocardiaceae bacterium]|jgi:effector-binding domain-containing protein